MNYEITHIEFIVNLHSTSTKDLPIRKELIWELFPKDFCNTLIIFPRLNGLQQLSPKKKCKFSLNNLNLIVWNVRYNL